MDLRIPSSLKVKTRIMCLNFGDTLVFSLSSLECPKFLAETVLKFFY